MMKKILFIIGLIFITFSGYGQNLVGNTVWARTALRLGDSTATFMYGDTIVNTEKVASMINDSIFDNADTIYISGQNEWIGQNDTIHKVDTANWSYNVIQDSTWQYIQVNDSLLYGGIIKFTGQSGSYIDSNTVQSDSLIVTSGGSDQAYIFRSGSYIYFVPVSASRAIVLDGNSTLGTVIKNNGYTYTFKADTFFAETKNAKFKNLYATNNVQSDSVKINYGLNSYFDNNGTPYIGLQIYSTSGSGVTYPNLKISNRGAGGSDSTIISGNSIQISNSGGWYGQMTNNTLKFYNSGIYTHFNPSASSNIYRFNTYNDVTSGYILDVQNQGTSLFTVKKDSTIVHNILKTDSLSIGGGDILTSSDTIDLKTAVEAETFEYIQLDTANESYSEGKLFYQKNTNALTFYNDINGFSHQPGYEFVRRVYNGTASTIPNGRAVRKIGTYKNGEIIASVALAGCSDKDSSYVYGIATVDIPAGSEGIVTRGGDVRNLNNPGLNDTIGYLGFAGEIIDTSPEAPNFSVKLCDIIYSDNDSGQVDVNISDPIYYPNPSFDAYFEDSLITITNPGTGVYAKITNALNNALIQDINIGYTFQGDSVSPKQDGKYTVLIAPSFKGDAAQNDLWRIGLFVDNVKYRSISRTSSSTNHGGVPFPVTLDLTAGQWLSFRISNESDGTRDAVLVDLFISITYIP